MPEFNFYHPIEVRYGDLDPQGHVNNARFMTYMEQARIEYVRQSGLWESNSFQDIGIILADAQVTFHAPILYAQSVQVGVRVTRLGNKSMTMEYRIEETQTGQSFASGSTVIVTYDYHTERTIPIPDRWRQIIAEMEDLPLDA
ncbi:MAG TPA: thioesterase family protein [Anaerolineales bacterium]|jgi:acyl-CoA thioester hydrolase